MKYGFNWGNENNVYENSMGGYDCEIVSYMKLVFI